MQNRVVSHEDWLKARLELLAAEKEFTRQRDALARRRRAMPWERVEKSYQFEGLNGTFSLADLFDECSQFFYKNESGEVFHTYSCHGRGIDMLNSAYQYLDLVPKGRDEDGFDFAMEWVRRHDQYYEAGSSAAAIAVPT